VYYIGLLSGTSMDAVDAALVSFEGDTCDVIHYLQHPMPADLRLSLRDAGPEMTLGVASGLDARLGELFAEAALAVANAAGIRPAQITAIGSHGQTILHCPETGSANSLQVGDPNRIAQRTGIVTVADFRRMDMAAGGQGAPLAPAFHAWRFRRPGLCRAVVNIGGIANISVLPAQQDAPVIGFDSGPGNVLMDGWIHAETGKEMDRDGRWASTGLCQEGLLSLMLADPYLSAPPPKSTGREHFNMAWLRDCIRKSGAQISPVDVQATIAELTCRTIADATRQHASDATEVLVCGGGVHNGFLMARLREHLVPRDVRSTAESGLDPDAVEAVTFAWLARCRLRGDPGNLPSVTGARQAALLGAIYEPGP
jgi:anhydro-N-acetylmuramic acid kinase